MYDFDYKHALYRRNNFGQPCVWDCGICDASSIYVIHGIVNKTINKEIIFTNRNVKEEIKSRYVAKRRSGYKLLNELKDNDILPVEGELFNYLNAYLPTNRTTDTGNMLPMKAKVYDNTNNRLFKKVSNYIGQWKINGLRCFISAYVNTNDMFKPIKLKFISCDGVEWNSLTNLEEYLLTIIDNKLLEKMVDECYILDGELYLPGHSVNEINHFVKDSTCKENKLLQYWCYDIAIEDTNQYARNEYLKNIQSRDVKMFLNKEEHFNNTNRFVVLPSYNINDGADSIKFRNIFINLGFEGLIMRNPNAEYQYGKRNLSMIKYKKSTDGKFTIIDIYPEGIKRHNIPLFLCKNDINNETFECHVGGTEYYQADILRNKHKYIGKQMYVEYGERSGVKQVPFHIKTTYIIQ